MEYIDEYVRLYRDTRDELAAESERVRLLRLDLADRQRMCDRLHEEVARLTARLERAEP